MTLSNSLVRLLAVSTLVLAAAAPAAADLPISVQLGAQFPTQNNSQNAGGDAQTNVGLNYDFIRAPVVPIQASFAFDLSQGTHGSGMLNEYGFGAAARLTTPIYVGAGISIYNVNARYAFPNAQNVSSTGIGENIFVGDRVLSLPGGVNFSLQATYKQLPSFDGLAPSSLGVGIRVQL
jgi:hypothetical protein